MKAFVRDGPISAWAGLTGWFLPEAGSEPLSVRPLAESRSGRVQSNPPTIFVLTRPDLPVPQTKCSTFRPASLYGLLLCAPCPTPPCP